MIEPTTFVALKLMEAQNYIVRKQLPPNKKNVHIYLSKKGRALKKKLVPLAIKSSNVGVVGIPSADIQITRRTLLAMIDNLACDEQLQEERGRIRAS